MSSVEFVKNIIDQLVSSFPAIECTYQYDISSNTHFVEVLPGSVYNLDDNYAKAETKATLSFIELFPHEGICFITDDAIVKLDNPIYTKRGDLFTVLPTFVFNFEDITSPITSWNLPLHVGISQNQSLFNTLIGSFDNIISGNKYWSSPPTSELPTLPYIAEVAENDYPKAA